MTRTLQNDIASLRQACTIHRIGADLQCVFFKLIFFRDAKGTLCFALLLVNVTSHHSESKNMMTASSSFPVFGLMVRHTSPIFQDPAD